MTDIDKLSPTHETLLDIPSVAKVATQQLSASNGRLERLLANLLVNEPFAFGYAMGFAESASAKASSGPVCPDYVKCVLGQMLGNEAVAASFLSFATSKRGTRVFEGGYDIGMRDLETWIVSRGAQAPAGLSQYLARAGRHI